jgi:hypothetical protein
VQQLRRQLPLCCGGGSLGVACCEYVKQQKVSGSLSTTTVTGWLPSFTAGDVWHTICGTAAAQAAASVEASRATLPPRASSLQLLGGPPQSLPGTAVRLRWC